MSVDSAAELRRVLSLVSFAPSCVDMDWGWEVVFAGPALHQSTSAPFKPGWLIRTTFQRPDTDTGEIGTGKGRWWFIESGTSVSGVVKTAWLACKQIVEHELMESFLYQSVRVFDPHADVHDLVDLNGRRG